MYLPLKTIEKIFPISGVYSLFISRLSSPNIIYRDASYQEPGYGCIQILPGTVGCTGWLNLSSSGRYLTETGDWARMGTGNGCHDSWLCGSFLSRCISRPRHDKAAGYGKNAQTAQQGLALENLRQADTSHSAEHVFFGLNPTCSLAGEVQK